MKAHTMRDELDKIAPVMDAIVLAKVGPSYVRVESIRGAAVDPVITGATTVLLDGEEYIPKASIQARLDEAYNAGRREVLDEEPLRG
jgi:hypothetical protein